MMDLLSYPRSVVTSVFSLLLTFFGCFLVLFTALILRSRKLVDFVIIYYWSIPMLRVNGVRVEVRGGEAVKNTEKGFLILFNHGSLMDIPALYAYFPRSFRFGAKVELFRIPFFGKAMEVCGVLPIDRGNRNKVMQVYKNAIARINHGECFALAPEGTRQNAETLGRFKRGPFEFAINAGMDVVPVVLSGAIKVLPKHSIFINMGKWRRKIVLQITPPIAGSEYTLDTIEAFQERVRAQMAPALAQLTEELKGF